MVFYRKYRPQKIDDLDSQEIREGLFSVLSLPEVPHAFLFTGPKGLGKTSTARIVAKAVNCEKVPRVPQVPQVSREKDEKARGTRATRATRGTSDSVEPCNVCESCVSITNGTNLDILEIDAASNRGIDEIRDLRDKIKLSPISAKKKVYIIDEVHMLTTEAFNALLKTLEEPPSHAMFILCTTELQKVPTTIISRCFQITFQPASKDELTRSLKRVADGEGLKIEDTAIDEIFTLVDGGLRDGHKVLEELAAMGEKTITKELVEKRYKVLSIKNHVVSLLEYLQDKDTKAALQVVQKLTEQGIDIKQFLQQLIEQLHGMLLEKAGIQVVSRGSQVAGHKSQVLSPEFEMGEIKILLELFTRASQEMKYAVVPELPIELAILEYSLKFKVNPSTKFTVSEVELLRTRSEKGESAIQSAVSIKQAQNGVTVGTMRKQVGDLARVKALYGEDKVATAVDSHTSVAVTPGINLLQMSNTEITPEWLNHFWNTFILEMKQHNHTVAGVLRGCVLQAYDTKQLVIETAYKFHKERLDDIKTRQILEQVCKTLTGNSVRVEVRLKVA